MCIHVIGSTGSVLNCFFSQIIQDLVEEVTPDSSSGPHELVYGQLKNAFSLGKAENNYKLQETILLSLAQLGR